MLIYRRLCYVQFVNIRFGKYVAGFSSAWLLQLRTYPQMCPVSIKKLLFRVKIWIGISIFKRISCLFWSLAGCQVPLKTWLTVPLTLPQSSWTWCPRGGVPPYSTQLVTICLWTCFLLWQCPRVSLLSVCHYCKPMSSQFAFALEGLNKGLEWQWRPWILL